MLQKVFKMTGVTLTVGRLLPKGIYWYQSSNRRFIHSCLFIHSHCHMGSAYSSCFMHVTVAPMRLAFFKIFSNFVYFCPNFQTNCLFLPWFCPFSENLHACPYFLEKALTGGLTIALMFKPPLWECIRKLKKYI